MMLACTGHWDEVNKGQDKTTCVCYPKVLLGHGRKQAIILPQAASIDVYACRANAGQKRKYVVDINKTNVTVGRKQSPPRLTRRITLPVTRFIKHGGFLQRDLPAARRYKRILSYLPAEV